MRFILIILCFLSITATFSQSLSDKYLHYRTYSYWDTILYESKQVYYYEMVNGKIIQKEYPVLQYLYTKIVSDSPLVTRDTFERNSLTWYPYKYTRNGKNIYLQYFNLGKQQLQSKLEYVLDRKDTVEGLAEKGTLDSEYGITVSGFSTYLGEETIEINEKRMRTFHFLEDHYSASTHPSYYTEEVFLEQKTLIPIKFVVTNYDFKTRRKLLYRSVTELTASGNVLADYTNKTNNDLILYQDKNMIWTEKQKQVFFAMFPPDMKQKAECLLKKLDGEISFYHFEQNSYFKLLFVRKDCE